MENTEYITNKLTYLSKVIAIQLFYKDNTLLKNKKLPLREAFKSIFILLFFI